MFVGLPRKDWLDSILFCFTRSLCVLGAEDEYTRQQVYWYNILTHIGHTLETLDKGMVPPNTSYLQYDMANTYA